jgi:Transposase IS66 family
VVLPTRGVGVPQIVLSISRGVAGWIWTFTAKRGVTPTNNHAERALRSAVIYRKLSLGS